MKKYYIETYGCQMNFAQSSQLDKKLQEYGFLKTDSYDSTDIVIINACSVREHAEQKVFSRINFFNSLKKRNNSIKLLVTGCFAQNHKEKIKSDIVMGSSRINDIPYILKNINKKKYVDVDIDKYKFLKPVEENKYPFRSMVDITKGCDNFCSYCIVPYVRGPQISRRSKDIVSEIKRLAGRGVVEIILLGQNVNTYGRDNNDIDFSELLYKANQINGIERIRFLTSHPKDFSDKIIESVFKNKKVASHFHLPLQSGSDRILKLMNRKYNMEKYHNIIEKINSYKKDYSLSTDFLVGFPGETEEDYLQTAESAKKIRFNQAFLFKYSSRPYIDASNFSSQVPEKEKKKRLEYLIDLQKKIEKEKARDNLNKIRTVLIEGESRRNKEQSVGSDELNYKVILNGRIEPGKFHDVIIRDIQGITMFGEKINTRSDEKCA